MLKSPLPVKNIANKKNQSFEIDALAKIMRRHFGYSEFRGRQLEAITSVLSGRDCFCLMPTGGGKSMCYQIPALAKSGVVLVVCPLIALMENQVATLKGKGIAAEFLSSNQTPRTKEKIHDDLNSGRPSFKLLYVTPELIATNGFMSNLKKLYSRGLLSLIAIDEAHCISTWGHDFRPSYRKLSSLRNHFPAVPILALTATAVPKVQKDVIVSLQLQSPLVLRSSFNRPNIFYEVRYKDVLDDAYKDLSHLLKADGNVCSIIYCLERATCDDLSAYLSKAGISCAAYHAGLNNKMRTCILDDWTSSKTQVVVATVAFGMGIDKKDVRIVCHFNIPKSMESFYQESGRAGRDQLFSKSVLYYSMDDRRKMEFILRNTRKKTSNSSGSQDELLKKCLSDFNQMVEYCEGSGCRRKKILESFGEQVNASFCAKTCDACKQPTAVTKYLKDLSYASTSHQRIGLSPIYMNSLSNMLSEDQYTEFLNGDNDESSHNEDISDSEDGVEVVDSLRGANWSSKSKINEKIEWLEKAEEAHYANKVLQKQKGLVDKKIVTEMQRSACKRRILNVLQAVQKRLGSFTNDLEAFATALENECYKKYGKTGKSFYNSQVASTVRWLSSSRLEDIKIRLDQNVTSGSTSSLPSSLPKLVDKDQFPEQESKEEHVDVYQPKISDNTVLNGVSSQETCLPLIPSFSEYLHQKVEENQSSFRLVSRHLPFKPPRRRDIGGGSINPEKRMRTQ